ncbi:protein-glucosylgalactosylhydroxylysine glucosidase-like [Saccoglossus kowalevskii]|uniref:Acid trehalase-like protein 1-like n=1 Tax=Saccoglossus kowalevskii TaxID=10224 RepID=A0ABM0LZX1_SACKO|nr:PREDICTED: acid trehalase-like protein 1-like [Saccoglossus kowalevskii]
MKAILYISLLSLHAFIFVNTVSAQVQHIIESDILPYDYRFRPNIGNGHIATNVLTDTVYMNGVMNGYRADSHRARIPSTNAINITIDDTETRNFTLNMYEGYFRQHIYHDDCQVEQTFYAHRSENRLMVAEIRLWRTIANPDGDLTVEINLNRGNDSSDFNMEDDSEYDELTWYTSGTTITPETNTSSTRPLHIYWTKIPDSLTLYDGQYSASWTYITSISTDNDDALGAYEKGEQLLQSNKLFSSHVDAWTSLWDNGNIEIIGNVSLGQTFYSSMYYMLSSTPTKRDYVNPFIGHSPGGLPRGGKVTDEFIGGAYNDYAGHVFWDMDTWVMPPIMMFFPNMATRMIEARLRVLDTVEDHATETGYEGVRFPWEQCYTGEETCPWPPASIYQIHVTADVSYSIRQYLYATQDLDLLTDYRGEELVMKIAEFWESRSVLINEDKGYEIYGVMGPDEYHANVNNSVFTNFNAKLSLQLPEYLLTILDDPKEDADRWREIADKMFIIFDEKHQYHPQFEGFDPTVVIKQSDVVLLGYPLMKQMTREVRKNDLTIYEELTDEYGPDTGTWSMHTVGWLELGEEEKADDMFKMMFRNLNGPFKVFSEKPAEGEDGVRCVNFITGAGGLIQAVVFGYGGFRIRADRLDLDPYVPKNSDAIKFHGIDYLGFAFTMSVSQDEVEVGPTEDNNVALDLMILVDASQDVYTLVVNDPVTFPKGKASLFTSDKEIYVGAANTNIIYLSLTAVGCVIAILNNSHKITIGTVTILIMMII